MKCKYCKATIPDGSIFCNVCGERQIRDRKKSASDITIPEPRPLKTGGYYIQFRERYQVSENGKTVTKQRTTQTITAPTKAACKAQAIAWKAGCIKGQKEKKYPTLAEAIDKYIEDSSKALSPATLAAYHSYRDHRFQAYMCKRINEIDWKEMVNAELEAKSDIIPAPKKTENGLQVFEAPKTLSVKTVKNAWSLIASSIENAGETKPTMKFPRTAKTEKEFLEPEMLLPFVDAVKNEACAIPALLGLHSLRFSEIKGLTWDDIDMGKRIIHISGAQVYDMDHVLQYKDINKTDLSQRDIPFMIPALYDILDAVTDKTGYVVAASEITVYKQVNRICKKLGYPEIGIHGLRHSFASLCFYLRIPVKIAMRLGGWKTPDVLTNIYTHLAKSDIHAQTTKLYDFFDGKPIAGVDKECNNGDNDAVCDNDVTMMLENA